MSFGDVTYDFYKTYGKINCSTSANQICLVKINSNVIPLTETQHQRVNQSNVMNVSQNSSGLKHT